MRASPWSAPISPRTPSTRWSSRVTKLDLPSIIGGLNPNEAEALQRYAPIFLDRADAPAKDLGVAVTYSDATYTVTGSGDHRHVTIPSFKLTIEADDQDATVEVKDGCAVITTGDRTVDSCESGKDITKAFDEAGLGDDATPEVKQLVTTVQDAFADFEGTGIAVDKVGGKWYVSPIATGFDAINAVLGALDSGELQDIIDAAQQIDTGSIDLPQIDTGSSGTADTVPFPDDTTVDTTPTTDDTVVPRDVPHRRHVPEHRDARRRRVPSSRPRSSSTAPRWRRSSASPSSQARARRRPPRPSAPPTPARRGTPTARSSASAWRSPRVAGFTIERRRSRPDQSRGRRPARTRPPSSRVDRRAAPSTARRSTWIGTLTTTVCGRYSKRALSASADWLCSHWLDTLVTNSGMTTVMMSSGCSASISSM